MRTSFFHPGNVELTPYAGWRLFALAAVGKLLGVQFHVWGIPFGAAAKRMDLNEATEEAVS